MPDPKVAQRYARVKRLLWVLDLTLSTLFLGIVVITGLATDVRSWVMTWKTVWSLQVAVYLVLLGLPLMLLRFPLDWIRSFRVEHRFGLSTQSGSGWLKESVKQSVLGSLLGLGIVEIFCLILRIAPTQWWLWATLGWLGWSILLIWMTPTLFIPIFYKQSPLKDPSVQQRLEKFLQHCGTRVQGIFELNLSTTTKKANACLCGLGTTRRVLVSDTLLEAYPIEEVEVVLAHEIGHHRFYHLGILILTSTVVIGSGFLLIDHFLKLACAPLKLAGIEDLAALPLMGLLLQVFSLLVMPITNGISRRLEKQADCFALTQTRNPQAFIGTMRRLAKQNLAELQPPRWVEWLLYDHPSIAKRIALAEQCQRQL